MPLQAIETRYGRNPLPTDDVSQGYGLRWEWLNNATKEKFSCVNNSLGAAIWTGGVSTDQLTSSTLDPTGFEPMANSDIVMIYNSTARTVTLTNVCNAYCKGSLVDIPEGWVSPVHADITGTYYLRYNCTTGQFVYDTTPWQWHDLHVAYTQYDSTTKIGRTVRELHSTASWTWHRNDHYNIGTTRISGGDVTGLVLNSTTVADRRPSITACVVRDEDADSIVPVQTTGSYTQRFLTGSGSTRSFTFNANDIVKVTGSQPLYNQWNGSAWVDTPMAVGDYAKLFLVAVPMASDVDSQAIRYMWVQPQSSSSTLSAIQAVTPNSITHGDSTLLVSEFVFIEEVIIRYIGGNWSIFSQSKLTGSRILQVGSPSGSYLSSVSTDSSLTGNGTVDNPLSAAPLTGQAAPTTSTVGLLGSIKFDTSGNRWELLAIIGSNYIWSIGGKTISILAGESISVGKWCYIHTDGKAYVADNTTALSEKSKGFIFQSLTTSTLDELVTGIHYGTVAATGLSVGDIYYLSVDGTISNTIPTTTGATIRIIGYAISSTMLMISIDNTYLRV